MAEYTNVTEQTVNPGEAIIFTNTIVPCCYGMVRHNDGTGNFLLSGRTNNCRNALYLCDFGCNVALPEGGTVGADSISVSIAIDGTVLPATTMLASPTATEAYINISRATNIPIWKGCCQNVSITNNSTQPILVRNANVIFTRPES